jgi:23S rRNA (uridine2552-2'-O)-methyltransferase
MARSKSSKQWLQEHFEDEYVKRAQEKGYRSRSTFKLIEIQEKDKIIKSGMNVVDLGAAPGGWSQYVRTIIGRKNKIIALDLLAIEPLESVDFIQGDFTEDLVLDKLNQLLGDTRVSLVLSDMAPNLSGNKSTDQARALYLAELALDMAINRLEKGGVFLVKVFQGTGFETYHRQVKHSFNSVVIRKPKASRARSNEVYILAKGFK